MRHASMFAALLLAACATVPSGASPEGPNAIPAGELGLGEWRTGSSAETLSTFEQNVMGRYAAGVSMSAVAADLRGNQFSCGDAPEPDQGRGDPPAQVCRRTVTAEGCTHTWQVHLFDESDGAGLSRTRGLYDRRCGNEGLLGGPG